MRTHLLLPLLVIPLLAACAHKGTTSLGRTRGAPPSVAVTTALANGSGEVLGSATLTQEPDGVQVAATIMGLPPGSYAIHLHANGKCDGPDFKTAGGHFNPMMKQHGSLNPMGEHAGDLPNLVVGADRRGAVTALRPGLRLVDGPMPLIDADGAAVVVHAAPDDYKTDPAGNAGARIACGVLAFGKPVS
jgi:Cu-Zn family superoxide dismutase